MNMVSDSQSFVSALLAIGIIVFLIVWAKLNPFISLMIGSGSLALFLGEPLENAFSIFAKGFGKTLGGVGILIALGAIMGNFLVRSGAADSIVDTFLTKTKPKQLPWVMAFVAFIVGIPLFFEVGVVLIIPVVMMVARRSNLPVILVGIPALAGLSALHGFVPPHPGPLIAVDALKANIGTTLVLGLIIAVPVVILAGPISGKFMAKWVPIKASIRYDSGNAVLGENRPTLFMSVSIILLPVIMMLARTVTETVAQKSNSPWHSMFMFIGEPMVALLVTTIVCMIFLGRKLNWDKNRVSEVVNSSFPPIAGIILVVGAGGGFKETLVETGVSDAIGNWISDMNLSPIFAGWLIAVFIRLATGSATIATITAAGVMSPLATELSNIHLSLLVLAIGAGSVIFSHVNDAGFWLVKEFFGMTVGQTIKTWSVMETILSITAIILIMGLSLVV